VAEVKLRPLRIGEILDVAIKLYMRNFWTLVKIVTILVVPLELVTVLIQISVIPDNPVVVSNPTFPGQRPELRVNGGELAAFIAGNVFVTLLAFVLVVLATAASFKAVSDAYLGEPLDWRASLRFTLGKWRSLTWLAILSAILLVAAFVALVIPGIYLSVAWSLATPVLLTEGIKGRLALKRSRRLMKGRWWPSAGAFIVGYLIASILTGVFVGAVTVFLVTNENSSLIAQFATTGVATALARVLTTPFQAAIVTILYFDLRVRKEGFDLQLLAKQVGVEPPTRAPDLLPPPPQTPGAPGSAQPPFWPPPPGWTPGPAEPSPPAPAPPGEPPRAPDA
jgi:hypothetical protein